MMSEVKRPRLGDIFDEHAKLKAENTALRTALVDSTELLRVALCLPDGEAYGFVDQIAANEAVTKGEKDE